MSNYLSAENRILLHKLDCIRSFARAQLELNPSLVELEGVLELISRFEIVPSDWVLSEPLCKSESN